MCIAMWGAYVVAYFTGIHIAIGWEQDSSVPVQVKLHETLLNELINAKQTRTK